MEEKYILNDEDINHLTQEQRGQYISFMETVYDTGVINKKQLEDFEKILHQQYEKRVLFNPNGLERYPEIFVKNVNAVLDTITNFRNDVISGKKPLRNFTFQNIDEGLDILKKNIEIKVGRDDYKFRNSGGNQVGTHRDFSKYNSVLSRIDDLKAQLSVDMKFYKGFTDERNNARNDYQQKKEAYDNLSLFGKVVARINGKKRELTEAARREHYYGNVKMSFPVSGDIDNPFQYDEYVERMQAEELNERRGR